MSTITKDLGVVTAYGYYKAGGGTMTESEFTQFMVDFGTASKTATEAAQAALESENAAKESEENAAQKSTKASESASTASSKAEEAAASATMATNAKTNAESARDAAAQSASEAAASASQAAESARTLTIDTTPTQVSSNAVSSGGVYEALADVNSNVADLDLRVEELEQGGSGGLSMTAVNLLNTILMEAVYGSDQTANIALLHKELSNIPPVSISAVLDGTALAGQSYSELSFTVTATFDDESTQVVDNYTIVTTGTVTAGSNTVTIRYRGITTTCTFTAEQVITYSITYNLTDVTSSNNTTVVRENTRYATEISTDSDHYISTFTVIMGGVDVTATVRNGNNIVIDAVTGNVAITVMANAYIYLDPLIIKRPFTNEGDSIARLYTDEYVTKASPGTIAYMHVGKVTEYPAKYDCTLNWTITNTSDATVALGSNNSTLGFGLIKDTDEYINNNAIAYWQKIDNTSHSLEPGESISGTYQMKAGWQLILTTNVAQTTALTERIRGDYVAEDFSEYTTYNITNADLIKKDPYKARTLYSDGGTEQLLSHTGNLLQYTTMDSPFVYDAYTRYVPINLSASGSISKNATGFVNTLSDENVYYAQIVAVEKTQMSNLWRHITLKATDSSMIWIFTAKLGNQIIDNYSLTVKAKEVSA